MKGGKRKLSKWNLFVKKIFHEGRAKNKTYKFKQALSDASRRKKEMGHDSTRKHHRKSRKHR
jgi:hypothetical protein